MRLATTLVTMPLANMVLVTNLPTIFLMEHIVKMNITLRIERTMAVESKVKIQYYQKDI